MGKMNYKSLKKPSNLFRWGNLLSLLLLLPVQIFTLQESISAQIEPDSEQICVADLPDAINSIRNRPEWARSRFGILVETRNGSDTLYNYNGEQYFIPASNTKLLTTAATLHTLSPDYRIATSAYAIGTAPSLTELRIVGRGNPSLTTTQLQDLAQQLKRQGIQSIETLVVEDGYFKTPAIVPSWEWEDIYYYYGTAANSLILNQNTFVLTLLPQAVGEPVQVRIEDTIAAKQYRIKNTAITASENTPYSVTITGELGQPVLQIAGELAVDSSPDVWRMAILNPAQYFLDSFRRTLALEGISVSQAKVTTTSSSPTTEVARVDSPPLIDLVTQTNQESNNLFAEALLQTVGSQSNANTPVEAVKNSLTELGVDPESYSLVDGSGLSRHNLVSPLAIVQTLQGIATTPVAAIYEASLPLAGETGTLRRRFVNTPLQGQFRAKTGTMTGVSALSGYLNPQNYSPLVFSIIINQSEQSASSQRQAIDEIVLLLGQVQNCGV